jgi:hypothetical protein
MVSDDVPYASTFDVLGQPDTAGGHHWKPPHETPSKATDPTGGQYTETTRL